MRDYLQITCSNFFTFFFNIFSLSPRFQGRSNTESLKNDLDLLKETIEVIIRSSLNAQHFSIIQKHFQC